VFGGLMDELESIRLPPASEPSARRADTSARAWRPAAVDPTKGVAVTVDPGTGPFGNQLNDEYLALATETGLPRSTLLKIARAGFEVADLPASTKQFYFTQLTALAQ
jgi:hypothetical protein